MKLTAITVTFKGVSKTEFHRCQVIDGKTICSSLVINNILSSLGCNNRGLTYSTG